jgi:hypothetical protein
MTDSISRKFGFMSIEFIELLIELHLEVWLQADQKVLWNSEEKHGEMHENFPVDFVVEFRGKCLWSFQILTSDHFSATAILAGLFVAIYFIIDDAIDKKIEACLTKHFYTEKVFEKMSLTSPTDPAKINYSKEDCQYIVDEGRNRTASAIRSLPGASDCVKNVLETHFLDTMLLKSALDKKNRKEDGSRILMRVLAQAMKPCNETMPN